jgi:LysM repeat protein
MLRTILISTCLVAPLALGACASVSDSIPVVKIEKKKPKRMVVAASYKPTEIDTAEAAQVCETDEMRALVLDGNFNNDLAKALVLEKGKNKPTVVGEVTVNCRDYFLKKSIDPDMRVMQTVRASEPATPVTSYDQSTQTRVISQAPSTPSPVINTNAPVAPTNTFYRVRRGDNVYDIARKHCTSVKTITRLNNLRDATRIDIGQVLKLPLQGCN